MDNELFIPVGMKAEKEFFQGFGRREIIQSIVAAVGLLIIAGIVHMITASMVYVVGILLLGMTAVIALVTRSAITNLSAVDQIRYMIRFLREQQEYRYCRIPE